MTEKGNTKTESNFDPRLHVIPREHCLVSRHKNSKWAYLTYLFVCVCVFHPMQVCLRGLK